MGGSEWGVREEEGLFSVCSAVSGDESCFCHRVNATTDVTEFF